MANAREKALKILRKIFEEKAYSNIAIDSELEGSGLEQRDKALATGIVYGVLTNLTYLDYQIKSYSKIPPKKLSPQVMDILRMSIYQICFLDRVPDSAAVNEGVKLAKKTAFRSSGFINAVLRAFLKSGAKLPDKDNMEAYLSVLYSYPVWMIRLWRDMLGDSECEKLLEAGNKVPDITIRTNEMKISADELAERLGAQKCNTQGALRISARGSIEKTEGFSEGLFTVQDEAAQMVTQILAPGKNEKILDMCAAPGGKTTHIGEKMENTGEVVAWDKYPHKITLIEKTAQRLGLSNIKPCVHDAGEPIAALAGAFDRVLLDAPCSGLGIIRKKPDIKWTRAQGDIAALSKEQKRLLSAAAEYVKPGGILLYSTCTVSRAENGDMIDEFLREHTEYSRTAPDISLMPHRDGTDGFFISKLKRSI